MGYEELQRLKRELHQLYDDYRTALLNVKYYSARLVRFKRLNFWSEILLAITSSSTVGTWVVWKNGYGGAVWGLLGALTAVLALLKPILQFPKSMERYQGLYGSYKNLFYDLESVVREVRIEHALDQNQRGVWDSANARLRELAPQDDPDAEQNKGWIKRFSDEVNREIPLDSLWIPKEEVA